MADQAVILNDTENPDVFTGGSGIDTVSYAAAARSVYADLSASVGYKLLRILPFGDSITYGVIGSIADTESGGYRTYLQQKLRAANVSVDMVGSTQNGPASIDPDHEGHRNYTINQLDAIDTTAIAATSPDAILLIAGTNDSAKDNSTTMIADLRALILSVTKAAPEAVLFVASVPPVRVGQQSQTRSDRVDAYNDKMPALIAELAATGRSVVFVDMRDLAVSDISAPPIDSGLHPNAAGYAKITDHWYASMEAELGLKAGAIGDDQDTFISIKNIEGSAFSDMLTGDAFANRLFGLRGDDRLAGLAGTDVLYGGAGNDTLDGGEGIDTAHFSGAWRDYTLSLSGDVVRVLDRRDGAPDGIDAAINFEFFAFANGSFTVAEVANDAPVAITDKVEVQASNAHTQPSVSGSLLANDLDADLALGDVLRVIAAHAGDEGEPFIDIGDMLTIDGKYGTLTITAGGNYVYALDPDRDTTATLSIFTLGRDVFSYEITDLSGENATATLAVTVYGAPVPPISTLYTRAGTQDGSALASQLLVGPLGANTFYFDVAAPTGADEISTFEAVDVLATSSPLAINQNGIVSLGNNGLLDFDGLGGSSDSVTIGGINPVLGLRGLGTKDGLSVYGSGGIRPVGAKEGTLAADRLVGDIANITKQVYFIDTALDIGFGNDRIERFGRHDVIVTTSALPDRNNDRIIDFGSDKILNIAEGNLVVTSVSNSMIQKLEFDGLVEHDNIRYYVYSLVGSAAGLADLQFQE